MSSLPPPIVTSIEPIRGIRPVVIDVRPAGPRDDAAVRFAAGHIGGARFLRLEEALVGTNGEGRLPLPSPERFASHLAAAGVAADVPVVAYDDVGGSVAARLVVLLRSIGQPAALLDGGLGSWHGPLETGPPIAETVHRDPRPWPEERFIGLDELRDDDRRADLLLVDSRPLQHHLGTPDAPAGLRGGHIPGSVPIPVAETITGNGTLRAVDDLRDRFAAAGIAEDTDVVAYCGAGVAASHTVLALEHAGLPPARLFVGSFSAWEADPGLPVSFGTPSR